MFNLIKKRASYLHEEKAAAPSKKLSDADLAYHHGKLADHYEAVAGEHGSSPSHEVGADLAEQYEEPGGGIDESFEAGKETEPTLTIDGEELEDLTGNQESPAYEKGETDEQEAEDDLGYFRGAGGNLRNSKEEEPLSKKKGKKSAY